MLPQTYPSDRIFLREEWQAHFDRYGYVILDGLTPEDLESTRTATADMIREIRDRIPGRYFPIGQLMDYTLRNRSTRIIDAVLPDIIAKHFDRTAVDYYSGTHLVKPRGRGSFLSTHQDSSLVDETKYHSVLMWCPLQDTHWLNGRLFVLEGSHRLGNIHRSTTIPWAFDAVKRIIYRHSKPLNVKAGQVCYFHSALIHHSGYNLINPYRIALSSLITSKSAPLINCFRDQDTPPGMVDIYETDMEFFHNEDFNKRPVRHKLLQTVPQRLTPVTEVQMRSMLTALRPTLA